jgi:hypothetical protein
MTIPESEVWKIRWRALRLPVGVLLVTTIMAVINKNVDWFSVGGSIISAIGARLWAERVFRLKGGSDDPLPPQFLEHAQNPNGLVALNAGYPNEMYRRHIDNIKGHLGVWISIIGTLIASVAPFIFHICRIWTHAP